MMFNHEETIYFDEQNNRSHFLYVQCVCVYLFTTYKVPVVLPVAGNVIRIVSTQIKFIYIEKATKSCEISTVDLTVTTQEKCIGVILQNFCVLLTKSRLCQFTCNNKVIDNEDQAVCGILKWNRIHQLDNKNTFLLKVAYSQKIF